MLSYIDTGSGVPLVMLHGLGQHKWAWESQLPLADKYRLIIPTLRGHGSTTLDKDITLPNMAKDVIALLDQLGIDEFFVCGLSLGGIVAQEIYTQASGRVRGLILANTAAYIDPILASGVLWYGCKHHTNPNFVDQIVSRALHSDKYAEEAKSTFLIRDCYMDAAKAPVGINYFPLLMMVDKPVLIISGEKDVVVPPIHQLFMRAALVKARQPRRVVLKNTGHLSNIEQAEEFNKLLDNFIKEALYDKQICVL